MSSPRLFRQRNLLMILGYLLWCNRGLSMELLTLLRRDTQLLAAIVEFLCELTPVG